MLALTRKSCILSESLSAHPEPLGKACELAGPNASPEQEREDAAVRNSVSPQFTSLPGIHSIAQKRARSSEAQADDICSPKRRRKEEAVNEKYAMGKSLQLPHQLALYRRQFSDVCRLQHAGPCVLL